MGAAWPVPLTLAFCLASAAASAAPPTAPTSPTPPATPAGTPGAQLPPVTEVRVASHPYPTTTIALTQHAGWTEVSAYVNVPQDVRLTWHVDPGGQATLEGRDAWDAEAAWREMGRWGRGAGQPEKGETRVSITGPTRLRLRARAGKFPRSGIARLRADYTRHTVAALRGAPGAVKRPVLLAEGYDPFNAEDWNDAGGRQGSPFAQLVARGRERHDLDTWILDWGDGGAALEQQAADFTEIARGVKAWNGDQRGTVAVGISMGAVTLRYALATAAGAGDDLGVRKYVSINGPHRGAWINPGLVKFLRKRAAQERRPEPAESSEAFVVRRALNSPAAQTLLVTGERHKEFYAELRKRGEGGYAPGIPRVAFSNGTLVREGQDLAELVEGKPDVVHRVAVRPLGLPFWLTVHKTRREFRYDAFPGELMPASMRQPVREHLRFLGLFRFDFRAQWEAIPTFIPTHSALDFPEDLAGAASRFRYQQWRNTGFSQVYVSQGHNLPHDETATQWIDPRTGKGAPGGENAILYEIAEAFASRRAGSQR